MFSQSLFPLQVDNWQRNLKELGEMLDVEFPDLSSLEISDFNQYSAVAPANVISTQSTYMDGRPMLCPMVQNTELHHGATYNFYNPSLEFGPSHDGQHSQMDMNVSQIRPEE